MFKYFKILRFDHLFKNLLILIPIFFVAEFEYENNIILFFKAFITLSCINLLCYLINDFTDQDIDKINKLKKNIIISNKEFLILVLSLTSLIFFLVLYFNFYNNFFIFLYLINFFLYNFFTKKIKFLDLFFLIYFYIIRILLGGDIFNIDLTFGFLIFFISLFIGLSLSKRVTQIQINELKQGNEILKYSLDDLKNLFKYVIIFFSISVITLFYYVINNYNSNIINLNLFDFSNYPNDFLIILLIIFSIWIARTINLLKKNLIKIDFYNFFIKDKYSYFSLIILIIYLLVRNIY